MRITTTPTEMRDAQPVDCRGCQHRVDAPGVDQVVCLAYLTVFNSTIRESCPEFEPTTGPSLESAEPSAH